MQSFSISNRPARADATLTARPHMMLNIKADAKGKVPSIAERMPQVPQGTKGEVRRLGTLEYDRGVVGGNFRHMYALFALFTEEDVEERIVRVGEKECSGHSGGAGLGSGSHDCPLHEGVEKIKDLAGKLDDITTGGGGTSGPLPDVTDGIVPDLGDGGVLGLLGGGTGPLTPLGSEAARALTFLTQTSEGLKQNLLGGGLSISIEATLSASLAQRNVAVSAYARAEAK